MDNFQLTLEAQNVANAAVKQVRIFVHLKVPRFEFASGLSWLLGQCHVLIVLGGISTGVCVCNSQNFSSFFEYITFLLLPCFCQKLPHNIQFSYPLTTHKLSGSAPLYLSLCFYFSELGSVLQMCPLPCPFFVLILSLISYPILECRGLFCCG